MSLKKDKKLVFLKGRRDKEIVEVTNCSLSHLDVDDSVGFDADKNEKNPKAE